MRRLVTVCPRRAIQAIPKRPCRPANVCLSRRFSSRPKEAPQPKTTTTSRLPFVLGVGVLVGVGWYWALDTSSLVGDQRLAADTAARKSQPLNGTTFVPFEVTAREPVGADAFVLTLRPAEDVPETSRAGTRAAVAAAWRHGTWSVEVRQPQLQIARDYTPLPESERSEEKNKESESERSEETKNETIRLYVRMMQGGEMTRYLGQKRVGDVVELRGPRLGFAVGKRMGIIAGDDETKNERSEDPKTPKKLVVLAGGTGIAPGLQAAAQVLRGSRDSTVDILWANRRADDSIGLQEKDSKEANAVVRDLQTLQTKYGQQRVRIRRFVDAEGTWMTADAVKPVVGCGSRWWWSKTSTVDKTDKTDKTDQTDQTDQIRLQGLAADPETITAAKQPKNIVLVSGPEGFVSAWTGPKMWAAGQERQGPVGGILGALQRECPALAQEWLVLKL